MKEKHLILLFMILMICIFVLGTNVFAADQLEPKRLASIGDSIVEAIDAEVYGANHWASWANGYHGFWQWLFGLSNVNSHNQLITREFGRRGRKNFMEAESGADSSDLLGQAIQAVDHRATYVPWLMGHNDICQDSVEDIPTPDQFEANARAALEILREGLDGATIYIVGMVDVPHLYNIAQDKKALGIVDCEVLWFFTLFELFPCRTVLDPFLDVDDRDAMSAIIGEYNNRLENLVLEFDGNPEDGNKYFYTNEIFEYSFGIDHVSDLDCFHPSPEGQRLLSEITWETYDGPRFQDW